MKHDPLSLTLLILFAGFVFSPSAMAEIKPEAIAAGKSATALVLLPGNQGTGTAFCIDERGYFITNQHVIAKLGKRSLTLVMNPATHEEVTFKAYVLDIDREADLALLRADLGEHKPGVLKIEAKREPVETQQLIAFGFPFGRQLAFNNDFPAVSVNLGRVTSLRKSDGELEAIQTDTTLNFGNSGGPMLNTDGNVAGVVVSGLQGTGVNFAIPASKVQQFLKKPRVLLTLPGDIAFTDRFKPMKLEIELVEFSEDNKPYEIEVRVGPEDNPRSYPGKQVKGADYAAEIYPVEPIKPGKDEPIKVEVDFGGSRVGFTSDDRAVRLDGKEIRLTAITLIDRRKAGVRVVMADGSEAKGEKITAPGLTADIGGARVPIDLSKAKWLKINRPERAGKAGFLAPVAMRVSRGGELLTTGFFDLRVLDPVGSAFDDLPEGFGGAPLPKGEKLVFDVSKDGGLKGWSMNTQPQGIVDGGLMFNRFRDDAVITYDKPIALASMNFEFSTENGNQSIVIKYGENRFNVSPLGHMLTVGETINQNHPKYQNTRVPTRFEDKKRTRATITLLDNGLMTLECLGQLSVGRQSAGGELSIVLENSTTTHIYRVELIERSDEKTSRQTATASTYSPPKDASPGPVGEETVALGSKYKSYALGGGGRYMLFHLPDADQIKILDLVARKIVHTLERIPDDALVTAGMDVFVVALPSQKILQKWSFDGFKREKLIAMPLQKQATAALLGSSSHGPLVLGSIDQALLIDLDKFKPIDRVGHFTRALDHKTRISADNRVIGKVYSNGYHLSRLDPPYVWPSQKILFNRFSTLPPRVSADGKLFFTKDGIGNLAAKPLPDDRFGELACYPTVDPRYFIAVRFNQPGEDGEDATQVDFCTVADRRTITAYKGLPELTPSNSSSAAARKRTRSLLDGRFDFEFVPWAKTLAASSLDRDAIHLVHFDPIKQITDEPNHLFIRSAPPVVAAYGGKLSYQIDAVSSSDKISYALLDGPAGASVSTAGLVTWDIPLRSDDDKAVFIISVTSEGNDEALHSFDLHFP